MKGQAFAAMKMGIAAVFAVALLTLVYYLTQNISPPTTAYLESSSMIKQALNAPNQCVGRLIVTYKANEILTKSVYTASMGLNSVTVKTLPRLKGTEFIEYNGECCSVVDAVKMPLSVMCTDVNPDTKTCAVYLGVSNCTV